MDLSLPVVITAAAVSSIVAEVIHPHVYGLDLIPSIRFEIGDNKYLHIHHWICNQSFPTSGQGQSQ